MKKIIILFVILLTISGLAFGQKTPKLLWEKSAGELYTIISPEVILSLTTAEKTAVTDNVKTKVFDKLGNELLSIPIYERYNIRNEKFKVRPTYDEQFKAINEVTIHDEEYNFVKNIKFSFSNKILTLNVVGDGFFCCTEKEIYKYNFKGDLLWKYDSDKKLGNIQKPEVAYSLFRLMDGGFLFLDKNGKKKNDISEVVGVGYIDKQLHYTSDGGFWYVNTHNFDKYDSTGLRTASIDFEKEKIKYIPSPWFDKGTITNSESALIVYQYQGQEMFFTKIESNGKLTTVSRAGTSIGGSFVPSFKMINNNEFMFSHNAGNKSNIGVINFQNPEQSWLKYISNDFLQDPLEKSFYNRSFLTAERNRRDANGASKITKINAYDLKGDLAWSFADDNINYNQIIGNFIYPQIGNSIIKIRLSDGKEIWKHEIPKGREYGYVMIDSEGNDYIYSCKSYGLGCKLDLISKNTNKLSDFFQFPEVYYPLHSNILIDRKTETITAILAGASGSTGAGYSLRKYSIRCLYDLEATAQATGKTEVCTGSKVKLSTIKQDGLTYQWQKDGKDIPTFRDVVHDVEESGNYTVTAKDEICQTQTTSNPIKVTIRPTPESIITTDTKGVVYEPFTVKMSANSGTGLAYQWLKDDAIIPNETKANYEAKKSGKYNVNVTYDGCTKLSDALTISILIPLANSEEIGEDQVQVYPNPSKGEFKIILPKALKSADIQLFDTFGRERSLVYVGEQAQADGLGQGVYFLRVQKGEKTVTSKLVIE